MEEIEIIGTKVYASFFYRREIHVMRIYTIWQATIWLI